MYVSTARNIPTAGKWGPRRLIQYYVDLDLPSNYAEGEEEIYAYVQAAKFVDRTREFEATL